MFKNNKKLHRALVALVVLAFLVCMSFVLWAGAEEAPATDTAVVTTAQTGAQSNGEALENFLNQTGITMMIKNCDWRSAIMIVISFVLMYLAIAKGFTSTMEMRLFAKILNNVDLPTLGLPTMATIGLPTPLTSLSKNLCLPGNLPPDGNSA